MAKSLASVLFGLVLFNAPVHHGFELCFVCVVSLVCSGGGTDVAVPDDLFRAVLLGVPGVDNDVRCNGLAM